MTWPYRYVRDEPPPALSHHWDYRSNRSDRALCGEALGAVLSESTVEPNRLCEVCEAMIPAWLTQLWQEWALEQDRLAAEIFTGSEKNWSNVSRARRKSSTPWNDIATTNVTNGVCALATKGL